jgi:ATP-dependent Lhr-like helicase
MSEQFLTSTGDENLPIFLPEVFQNWFTSHGWQPRAHQLELLGKAQSGKSTLLIAPTGAGKTLAGFLPTLVELSQTEKPKPGEAKRGIHTLYISPLKALAVDIKRNLERPIAEMGLDIAVETRTGDTPVSRRQRQKLNPPQILLTTPEQLALLIANKDATRFFDNLQTVVFDELHSLITSKRGHLLALGLARLRTFRPNLKTIGLSATVADPDDLRRWLVTQPPLGEIAMSEFVHLKGGAKPEITILKSDERIPWAGHSARYAMRDVYDAIKTHKTTLLFVNTRSQAEMLFKELWNINDDTLPIALHHGSLDVGQRRRVEEAMQRNELRGIVATSTLDLGIDWGDVDLVIHVGAPKGASRLAQRIGRANHRIDDPSRAILVPANRFEVMECQAALNANYIGAQDTPPMQNGSLDVLAQHVLGTACAGPFNEDQLYEEITSAAPYAELAREEFSQIIEFVATGGYALKAYEQYAKISKTVDGSWRLTHPSIAQRYRMNCGTIVEAPMLDIRLTRKRGKNAAFQGGPILGKLEEGFIETMAVGDTFLFAGQTLRLEGIREASCYVSKAHDTDPKIPYFAGGKFPLSTYLADQVRGMLANESEREGLPPQVKDWIEIQRLKSVLPNRDQLLVETFPRGDRYYLVAYPFEGRLAHQTLGMLLTRRMERARARPLGFVATDYAIAIWGLRDFSTMIASNEISLDGLFDEDMLGDDLETWLDESFMLKRTFRHCATIAGLIERRFPGKEKSGRQMTVSSDLIYDVLRSHDPEHILLKATRADAAYGLLDVRRLGDMLSRTGNRIVHKALEQISPLAVPIMLEVGKESIAGEAQESILEEAAQELADIG